MPPPMHSRPVKIFSISKAVPSPSSRTTISDKPENSQNLGRADDIRPYKSASYVRFMVRASSAWVPADSQMKVGDQPRRAISAASGAQLGP